ncbi:hypothetical protein [uncultured Desulfosarcina sp.]|uniref:hypothetical protein n=1 Tax=uncultured Desulfosarcina sp. TaxID=218289 RepID=UPI0029C85588|nr:hypothetical protein [uncultured Desulfosarcina sp.]
MSSPYDANAYPVYPPAQQSTGQNYYQTYYQTTPDGQAVYMRTPDAAIRERSLIPTTQTSTLGTWFDYSNPSYIKGLLLGAGVTLLVTNQTVQNAVIKGTVAAWSAVVGGIEEIKEKVRDAKAEKSMT